MSTKVGVVKVSTAAYPEKAPFNPSHPEYPFPKHGASEVNAAYEAVRALFRELGFDIGRFDTPDWSPTPTIWKRRSCG